MTGQELVDLLESRFGDPDDVVHSAAEYLDYINDAYFEVISASQFWPFLETSSTSLTNAANTRGVSLPTDIYAITGVLNVTDKIRLQEISPVAALGFQPNVDIVAGDLAAEAPGTPVVYRMGAQGFDIFPTPDHDVQLYVEYRARPAALLVGDSPVFPAQYHRLLVYYALAQVYLDDDDQGRHDALMATFERRLERMKTELLGARGDSYPQINDNFFE